MWIPKTTCRVQEIPVLASGKLNLQKCQELAAEAKAGDVDVTFLAEVCHDLTVWLDGHLVVRNRGFRGPACMPHGDRRVPVEALLRHRRLIIAQGEGREARRNLRWIKGLGGEEVGGEEVGGEGSGRYRT